MLDMEYGPMLLDAVQTKWADSSNNNLAVWSRGTTAERVGSFSIIEKNLYRGLTPSHNPGQGHGLQRSTALDKPGIFIKMLKLPSPTF